MLKPRFRVSILRSKSAYVLRYGHMATGEAFKPIFEL